MTGQRGSRPSRSNRRYLIVFGATVLLGLLLTVPSTPPPGATPASFPGMGLLARVEDHLQRHRQELANAPAHYALVFELEQRDLLSFMQQIQFHRDGTNVVLGVSYAPESHGGGLLDLLLGSWQFDDRPARLEDSFAFAANGESLALREIYSAHRRQVFLPVPGTEADALDSDLPTSPQLPRMRFRYWADRPPFEVDAYKFLGTLVVHEADPKSTWTNAVGQELSVDLLLDHCRDHYLARRGIEMEIDDHSNLHLVELLLAHDRRHPEPGRVDAIRRRFLEVELEREHFEGEDGSEALAHYVESLGVLVADPRTTWSPEEKRQVRAWLLALEQQRFRDLDRVPLQHQAHLARGLRLIDAHRERLE